MSNPLFFPSREQLREFVRQIRKRAQKDTDDDGSMIQYWVDKTQYEFGYGPYICPATGELLDRDELDGAHVEIVDYPNMGLFITLVKKGFNRSHKRTSFFVKPEYLVVAPEEK